MNRVQLTPLAGLCAGLALFLAAGCCQEEKRQIQDLRARVAQGSELEQKNQDLQQTLADREMQISNLRGENGRLAMLVQTRDARISRLEEELAGKPATAAGLGWEKGLVGDRITVESDILFASGKATLTSAGQRALDKVVGDLKREYAGKTVRVYGYTDTDPISKTKHLWKDNLDLSANRAMAVTRHLREKGIDADRIETIAMGQLFQKKTKPASRRVEIIVIK